MRCVPILLILALAACKTTPADVEVREVAGPTRYVRVDPKLTAHDPLPPKATTSPIEAPKVAAERRALLEKCYFQLDQIKAIEGTTP